jgi:gas vesicle protein
MAEYYDHNDSSSGGSFMMGLITGAVIGAGIGLLLAPKAGSALRQDLTSKAGDLAKRGRDLAGDLAGRGRQAGEELYDQARHVASRAVDQAERYVEDVADTMPKPTGFPRG